MSEQTIIDITGVWSDIATEHANDVVSIISGKFPDKPIVLTEYSEPHLGRWKGYVEVDEGFRQFQFYSEPTENPVY
jgi:hypothetical protein